MSKHDPPEPESELAPSEIAERIHDDIADSRIGLVVLRQAIGDEEQEEADRAQRTRRLPR
jgi:hypothetical protein